MTTDLIPAAATLLAAALCAYFTFHERSAGASELRTPDSSQWGDAPSAIEPGPRDRCECGHTYDWHHSCVRDICGCREFSYLRETREQRHEAA